MHGHSCVRARTQAPACRDDVRTTCTGRAGPGTQQQVSLRARKSIVSLATSDQSSEAAGASKRSTGGRGTARPPGRAWPFVRALRDSCCPATSYKSEARFLFASSRACMHTSHIPELHGTNMAMRTCVHGMGKQVRAPTRLARIGVAESSQGAGATRAVTCVRRAREVRARSYRLTPVFRESTSENLRYF